MVPGGQARPLPTGLAFEGTTFLSTGLRHACHSAHGSCPTGRPGRGGGGGGRRPTGWGLGSRSSHSAAVSVGRAGPRESLLSRGVCVQPGGSAEECTGRSALRFSFGRLGLTDLRWTAPCMLGAGAGDVQLMGARARRFACRPVAAA